MTNFRRNDIRKSMTTMTMLMTSMLGFAACSSDGASKEAADVSANDDVPTDFQIQYTTAVPSDFFQAATQTVHEVKGIEM